MSITIKINKYSEEEYECDNCGTCYPEGMFIEFNDEKICETHTDGHFSGFFTEKTILDAILDKWHEIEFKKHQESATEEKRIEWNKNHPGNGIARTEESWKEYKNRQLSFLDQNLKNIKSNCENLPYDEILQVKMIALWIENEIREKVNVIEITDE